MPQSARRTSDGLNSSACASTAGAKAPPFPAPLLLQALAHEQTDQPGQQIQRGTRIHCHFQADRRQKPKVRHQTTRHGSGAVDAIQPGYPRPQLPQRTRYESSQGRQGGAHQDGGQKDRHQTEEELHAQQHGSSRTHTPRRPQESIATDLEISRENQRVNANANLQPSVKGQRPARSIRHRSQPGIAQGKPPHERHQDRHHRVTGVSEKKREIPRPNDLVGKPRNAGAKKASGQKPISQPRLPVHDGLCRTFPCADSPAATTAVPSCPFRS